MLDVHPPHEPVHGWRDFLLHILTITIGLLIALLLEAMVEHWHHHREVAETREALRRELEENQQHFSLDTAYYRKETAELNNNLLVLHFLEEHPHASAKDLPGVLTWESSYARMDDSAWRTALATQVSGLMPQAEVRQNAELYAFFERMDGAHEHEADAIAQALGPMFRDANPLHLGSAAVTQSIALTEHVLAWHLRQGFLMQNLAERYPGFRPAPTRSDLEPMLHLPTWGDDPTLRAAKALTAARLAGTKYP